jgi:quercetin dioxygenase-like cupin family protein
LNRPEGGRVIDAPFVFVDLKKYSEQLREEGAWDKNDRNSITIYKTEGYTMVLTWLRNGAMIKDNLVGGLLTVQVLKGTVDFTVETGTVEMERHQLISIHPGIMHTIRATDNALLLITNKVVK